MLRLYDSAPSSCSYLHMLRLDLLKKKKKRKKFVNNKPIPITITHWSPQHLEWFVTNFKFVKFLHSFLCINLMNFLSGFIWAAVTYICICLWHEGDETLFEHKTIISGQVEATQDTKSRLLWGPWALQDDSYCKYQSGIQSKFFLSH